MVTRILLLLSLSWIVSLEEDLFSIAGFGFSGRDLILLGGGLFLVGKATYEIGERLEGETGHSSSRTVTSFSSVIVQILLLDIVFSLDSVITAVGMVDEIPVMIAAVVVAEHRPRRRVQLDQRRPARSATSSTAIPRSRCWRWPFCC